MAVWNPIVFFFVVLIFGKDAMRNTSLLYLTATEVRTNISRRLTLEKEDKANMFVQGLKVAWNCNKSFSY